MQVDGIPPPPVGRADPIPDATGELDDPRLAGHPAQAEQFADRRGSSVRSQYHEAKGITGKDDLPGCLHRCSSVSASRTSHETHGRHGAQRAVTPAGDRRQRGSTVTCPCSTRRRGVAELRTIGPCNASRPPKPSEGDSKPSGDCPCPSPDDRLSGVIVSPASEVDRGTVRVAYAAAHVLFPGGRGERARGTRGPRLGRHAGLPAPRLADAMDTARRNMGLDARRPPAS